MSIRVSPSERIRAEIDALFGGDRDLAEVLDDGAWPVTVDRPRPRGTADPFVSRPFGAG